jgi:hypothetical protein
MDTFTLRIDQPQPGGDYRATLTGPQGNDLGTAQFPVDLALPGMANPFTPEQMRQVFAATTGESADLPIIGAQLYALLGQNQLHHELDPDGSARRTLLQIDPPELRSLPWELLKRGSKLLMRSEQRPICRGSVRPAALAAPEWPLRVLIVDGGEEILLDGQGNPVRGVVEAGEEIAEVIRLINDTDKVADIDLLVLTRPTRGQILQAFEDPQDDERHEPYQGFKPHIFHFIGHGNVVGGQAFLQLWGPQGQPADDWFADDIPNDFGGPHKPRLVLLNACKTAEAAQDGLWSLTDAFLDAGIPAVVGMRANISGEHARLFSSGLYKALAQGKALDEAMAEARLKVSNELRNPTRRLEWAAPTLEVRVDPATVISVGSAIDGQVRARVRGSSELSRVRGLVDRRPERSGAWRRVAEDQLKVVVVRGKAGVGKTAFAHLLMERCALCGHQVRYVNLAGESRADFLTVLRRTCDGEKPAVDALALTGPLPGIAFQPFKDAVQEILGAPLSPESNWSAIQQDVDRRRIVENFQKGLEQSIAAPPLVLVLDHLRELHEDQVRSFLLPNLLTWCARRPTRDLLLVLLLSQDDYDRFDMKQVRGNFRLIDIEGFPKQTWRELAWEFAWRNLSQLPASDPRVQLLGDQIDLFGKITAERWSPSEFELLKLLAEKKFAWPSR